MQRRDVWLFFIICVICLLVMLPRILSAQFGLLDDGVLLMHAQVSLGDLKLILYQYQAAGRFLPTALSLRAFVFSFAGFEPQRWYIWSSFLLIIICIELAYLVRRHGFNRMQALLSVLFFVISPASIENFYTLSKAEIPLLLLISSAILLAMTYNSSKSHFNKTIVVAFSFLLLLLSYGAKETTTVLPFLFLSWLVISWICFRKTGQYRDLIQSDTILLLGSLVGCVLYWVFRSMLGIGDVNSYSGGYDLLNLEKILFNFKVLLGWLVRDYPYLLPALLAMLFVKPLRQMETASFALRWLSWMGASALILLPWNTANNYYLLPFSFGSALFSGVILGQMIALLFHKDSSTSRVYPDMHASVFGKANRGWLFFLCVSSIILIIPPACNATAYATEQLMFDRANWQMLEQVVRLPQNSRLLVNMHSRREYFFEIGLFVGQILNRPDISIEAYEPPSALDDEQEQDIYIISPVLINQVLPCIRGLSGAEVTARNEKLKEITRDSELIYSTRLRGAVVDIGLHRLLSFLGIGDMIGYSDRGIVTDTVMVYGWDLWQYSPLK